MGFALTTKRSDGGRCAAWSRGAATQSVMRHRGHATLDMLVNDTLHALVRRARNEGHTWAEIGQVLNVSRQAAFQKIRWRADPPDTGDESLQPIPDPGPRRPPHLELVFCQEVG